MIDLVNRRLFFFLLSLVVVVPGVASLLLPGGLKLGIEFQSGSTMTIHFDEKVELAQFRQALAEGGYPQAIIQRTGEGNFFLRLREISREEKEALEAALKERFGGLKVLDFSAVSPIVAREMGRYAIIAVMAGAVGILLYIAWAFRRIAKPWRYGVCGVVALAHDVIVTVGIFSLLGRLFNVHIDAMFIAATLAIVGYSINDTVVIYDRIRENSLKRLSPEYPVVVNQSLVETLPRSINTNLTTMLTLLALFLFGGETIRYFVLAFLIGVSAGTYSSIFIASQLLVVWEKRQWGRLRGNPGT